MERSRHRLSVIVVTWNARDFLKRCLLSLAAETRTPSLDVHVVDNASTDGSADMVESEFPGIRLTRNFENLGFAKANNIALRRVLEERQSEYILLLNADVAVLDGAVDELVKYLDGHPEAGAAGPALVLPGGKLQAGVGGFLPSALSGLAYFLFLSRVFPGTSEPLFIDQAAVIRKKKPKRVEWLSGACLLVRRRTVEKVGLLNEDYFFYLDDIDWGKRMGERGIALHYVPWTGVLHDHGVTYRRVLKRFNTKWLDMLFEYVRKDRGTVEAGLFRAFAVMGFLVRLVYYGVSAAGRGGAERRYKLAETAAFLRFSLGIGRRTDPLAGETL